MLADFVDGYGTVVICLFSNSTSYTYPRGRFQDYHPLVPASDRTNALVSLGVIENPNHPIMNGVKTISQGTDMRRAELQVAPGDVEIVAKWSDGLPLVAVRNDKNGYVISITCQFGSVGVTGDGMQLLVNSLLYWK